MKKYIRLLIAIGLFLTSCSIRPYDVDLHHVRVFFGHGFYDLPGEIWVEKLRYSREKDKLAVWANYKVEDDVMIEIAVMNPDGTAQEEITLDVFNEFDKTPVAKLPVLVEARLTEFVKEKFKPHPGILGGTVTYEIVSKTYSPDKSKIAFLIEGEDGHAYFNPALYISDSKGNSITRIDSSSGEMCKDIIWLYDNEILYVKGLRLWKAVIK
jgi:hypothetical protein